MDILTEPVVFIPKFGGNRTSENGSSAKFYCAYWTYGEMMEFSKSDVDNIDYNSRIVKKYIVKIENLTIDGDPIMTGEELINHKKAPAGLVIEIIRHLIKESALTEATEKN